MQPKLRPNRAHLPDLAGRKFKIAVQRYNKYFIFARVGEVKLSVSAIFPHFKSKMTHSQKICGAARRKRKNSAKRRENGK